MKTNTFRDGNLQSKFDRLGYIKLDYCEHTLIDDCFKRIVDLKPTDNYQGSQITPQFTLDYHCTFFDSDYSYRNDIYQILTNFFKKFVEDYLTDHKFVQANIFNKPPNEGYVTPHQNLTVVDEERYNSISLWMPVIDTDENNGTMYVVPGSHKYFEKYRNTSISWPYLEYFKDYSNKRMTPISVKKGEILVLNDKIVHGTPTNKSDKNRFVFHSILAPMQAQCLFCVQENEMIQIYEVPDFFWQNHLPGDKVSQLKLIKTVNPDHSNYSEKHLNCLIESLKGYTDTTFKQKIYQFLRNIKLVD